MMEGRRKENRSKEKEQDRKYKCKYGILAGSMMLALLSVLAVGGQKRIGERTLVVQESMRNEREQKREEDIKKKEIEESLAEKASMEAETDEMLSGAEREAYQILFEAMQQQEYEIAAQCLEKAGEMLEEFSEKISEEEKYLFDGEHWRKEDQGYGLFVNPSGVAYLGEWQNGLPNGKGAAIRILILEDARYDLSEGQWSQGKMKGEGKTGYCYYNGVEEPKIREIWKKGIFQDDLMEGNIEYISKNASGAQTQWSLTVKEGVTVLDERWKMTQDEKQFRLSAETDGMHDYVLDSQKADAVLWKNMVEWK